jgi:predicted DNA-binding transcriptional regulator AlpA
MNAIFFLMGQFDCKLTLTLEEVCQAIGYAKQTGYNEIGAGTFPIPMQKRAGKWLADVRDVAEFLDEERARARVAHSRLHEQMQYRG